MIKQGSGKPCFIIQITKMKGGRNTGEVLTLKRKLLNLKENLMTLERSGA